MPPFWTNISLFPFNFTGFDEPEAAILGYAWGIGSEPATDNVIALGAFSGTVQARAPPPPCAGQGMGYRLGYTIYCRMRCVALTLSVC